MVHFSYELNEMKLNRRIILLAFVFLAAFAVATGTPVRADSCTAQLGTSSAMYYYYSNIGLTVPVSANCASGGGQLYALGNVYDASTNVLQGSSNTVLTSAYGASTYNGQLSFKLPLTLLGRNLRVAISLYSPNYYSSTTYYSQPGNFPGCDTASMACNYGIPYPANGYGYSQAQYGQFLTTVSETIQLNPTNYYNPNTNPSSYNANQYQGCSYYGNCNYQTAYCSYHNPYCYYNGNPTAEYCSYYGSYCDFNYNVCQSPYGYSNQAQCSGYLFLGQNGCTELVVPVNSPYAAQVYQYYTLYNLPSSHPPAGSWVTVTENIYQGYNGASSYNAACPGNYINVSSIS
jgi:hypothetical protein